MTTANDTPQFNSLRLDDVVSVLTSNDTYVFVSKYTAWDSDVPTFYGTVADESSMWREMVYGKKISNSDVSFLVTKNEWANGDVYEAYSQDHPSNSGDFYVITDERKVFKCLYNNSAANSVSKPTSTVNSSFTTADGYIWKYMYTVSAQNLAKFSTSDLMPIERDSNVESTAISGTIDAVRVVLSGNNWTAHDDGSVLEKISNTTFRISGLAVPSNGYYEQSAFFITAGSGAGTYRKIGTYESNSSGNFVSLTSAANTVSFGSSYSISPYVEITGDGSGAVAYSVVNSTSDIIESVVVVNVGSGYTWANVTFGSTGASSNSSYTVEPVISPYYGHGYDPVVELGAEHVCISVPLSNTDSVMSNFSFRACGLLKTPTTYANSSAAFTGSEFSQYHSANVTMSISTPAAPNPSEKITGQTSGASATVITSNTTYLTFSDILGTFTVGEGAISNVSSSVFTLDAINNPSLSPHRGDILMGSYFLPVTRSNTSNEKIKFVVNV